MSDVLAWPLGGCSEPTSDPLRGSAARYQSATCARIPAGRQEAIDHLKRLYGDLRAELTEGVRCRPFHEAFKSPVQAHATPSAIAEALNQIEKSINNRDVFANVFRLPINL